MDIFKIKAGAAESEKIGEECSKSRSITGKILLCLTGGIGIGLTVVCASFVAPAFRRYCLPYVPATPTQIENVISLLPKKIKGKLLDIGSGDGRIVIATSRHGWESHGVELNSWLVLYSRLSAFRQRAGNKTKFYRKDLWKFNISSYDCVVIFGVEQMMTDLERKITKEAKHGAQIIACRFPFPGLLPDKISGIGVDTVWLYTFPQARMENG